MGKLIGDILNNQTLKTVHRGFRFKLRGTSGRVQNLIRRFAGCRRFIFNKGLEIQKRRVDNKEKLLNYPELCKLLTAWKAEPETAWLSEAPSSALQQGLRDLGEAFSRFRRKLSRFPVFHKKGTRDSFRIPQASQFELDEANSRVKLPKIGWVRYWNSRKKKGIPVAAKSLTVSVEADGYWISIHTEEEAPVPVPEGDPVLDIIGIDLGVKRFITLSSGEYVAPLNAYRRQLDRLISLQRNLSRKKEAAKERAAKEHKEKGGKGKPRTVYGKNYIKARKALARQHKRVADCRRDFLHKVSTELNKNHVWVAAEDLRILNLTASAAGTFEAPGRNVRAKSGLNRSILDQGWGMFLIMLSYKLEARGGALILVNPRNTSRTCPACGHVSADNRKTQAEFRCVRCGFSANADLVGAINVKLRAVGQIVANACGGLGAQGQPVKQEPAEGTPGPRSGSPVGIPRA